jgi:hypothetical protein
VDPGASLVSVDVPPACLVRGTGYRTVLNDVWWGGQHGGTELGFHGL